MRAAQVHHHVIPVASLGIEHVNVADRTGGERRQLKPVAVVQRQVNNLLIVGAGGSGGSRESGETRFLIFDRTASGDTKPKYVVRGPRALGGPFAIYPQKKLIFATNRPYNESLAGADVSYLGVWSYEKPSEGGPIYTIGGPGGVFQMPRGVALDVKNKSIIASDKHLNSVFTFRMPELF